MPLHGLICYDAGMKPNRLIVTAFVSFLCLVPWAEKSGAQDSKFTGAVAFVAQVSATSGQPDPVRELSFFLLRKSMADIRDEAAQSAGMADMDSFVDGLKVSPELKSWMKKHHTVELAGTAFTKQLTPEDIMDVPEFLSAYKTQNGSALGAGVPEPKYKKSEQQTNPEKFKRQHDQYIEAVRRYIQANPDSIDGLDADLAEINPSQQWAALKFVQEQRLEHLTIELAINKYLAAKTTSDLYGRGEFAHMAAGDYWVTNLDTPALAGDLRVRWDLPVTVHPGETAQVELSNLNAIETPEWASR